MHSLGRGYSYGRLPASMGPPRERGGCKVAKVKVEDGDVLASMGPPRERGGCTAEDSVPQRKDEPMLQWGHRVNAVDAVHGYRPDDPGSGASMGPPRERGGCGDRALDMTQALRDASMGPPRERGGCTSYGCWTSSRVRRLQWGHRVNAVDATASRPPTWRCKSGFNGATA